MKRSIKMAITIILVVVILVAAYPSGAYMETGEITQDINRKWTVVKDGDYRNKYSDPSVLNNIINNDSKTTLQLQRLEDYFTSISIHGDASENRTYPNYFGGKYINENGELVICLSDNTIENRNLMEEAAGGGIAFKSVKHSYNELSTAKQNLTRWVGACIEKDGAPDGLYGWGIGNEMNCLMVDVKYESEELFRQVYDATGRFSGIVFNIMEDTDTESNDTEPVLRRYTLIQPGSMISLPIGSMSIGFRAMRTLSGKRESGFVTAGHAASYGDSVRINGIVAGTVSSSVCIGNVDAAFVAFNSSEFVLHNLVYDTMLTLNDQITVLSDNKSVCMSGMTSGYKIGSVIKASYDYVGETGRLMTNTIRTDCSMARGDSGGIVFTATGSPRNIVGIIQSGKASETICTRADYIVSLYNLNVY